MLDFQASEHVPSYSKPDCWQNARKHFIGLPLENNGDILIG